MKLFTMRSRLTWRAPHRHHALVGRQSLRCISAVSQAKPASIAVGDVLTLNCTGLSSAGEGVCRTEGGCVVFVERALPGEAVEARVVQHKKSWARAVKVSTLEPTPHAALPRCQHFGPCGGCSLQALQYEEQLRHKQEHVAELLRRVGKLEGGAALVQPIVPCTQQYGHRNKMEFSFSTLRWQPGASEPRPGVAAAAVPAAQGQRDLRQGSPPPGGRAGEVGRGRRGPGAGPARWGRDGSREGGGRQAPRSSKGNGERDTVPGFALGLFKPGSNRAVLPVSDCKLQPEVANELLQLVVRLCWEAGLQPYDPASRRGLLQVLTIRTARGRRSAGSIAGSIAGSSGSSSTDGYAAKAAGDARVGAGAAGADEGAREVMLNFVTARDGSRELRRLVGPIMEQFPSVVSIVNTISDPSRPLGERAVAGEQLLAGRPFLLERLCGLDFEVSPNSFFQTNTQQAEVLYNLVAEAAELRPSDVVLDLYCGTGTIALALARSCREVHGVEVCEPAVGDAVRNAARNRIANAHFHLGDLDKLTAELLGRGRVPPPDVVVVDPARQGLSPQVVDFLRRSGARRLVYVSCNPAALARDLSLLCAPTSAAAQRSRAQAQQQRTGGGQQQQQPGGGPQGGGGEWSYLLRSVQPIDMFPQTMHVESVCVLDRVGA